MRLLFIGYLVLILSCFVPISQEKSKVDDIRWECDDISSVIGYVDLREGYTYGTPYQILNLDGSLFLETSKEEGKQISDFRCLGQTPDYFLIDYFGEQKYISKSSTLFEFFDWETYLTDKIFSVSFEASSNPLRASKNGKPLEGFKTNNNHHIMVLNMSGDWLQISYEDFETETKTLGWIKWRENGCLLIEIFLFA